ncbi:MAG TPA: NAD(P)/FAD-dependent oxidoreductase [Anaerolineales bacterium]|nr:NAD(P)/FAD-dependent oxidoreductase [Anaerolineales bacterium]
MYDVIIIGGGPAGSTLGSYLSKAGIKNLILEGHNHPRPHVGESLVLSTMRVFGELGLIDKMDQAGFPKKFGASWRDFNGKEQALHFAEFRQEGIDRDHTYHVDRSKFDLLLLKHAESLGSEVHQGVQVRRVNFEGDQAVGVRARFAGQEIDIPAKIVVDASGRQTLLGRQLNLKQNDKIFNQYAVHGWFENVARGEDPKTEDYIHIYFLPVKRGWAWQIPINDKITSVGVVAEREVFQQFKSESERYFNTYVESNKGLAKAMANAVRVNEFKTEGDYSYILDKFCGNGFLMVGDAARFVDPIFSSGVSVAMHSARFAAQTIQAALESGDLSEASFKPYEETLRGGVDIWYEFIRLYYKLLPLFTLFIQSEYRVEVLRLLQGEVFNREDVKVLNVMRRYIEAVENNERHVFRGQLTDVPIDDILKQVDKEQNTQQGVEA